jgi:parvulin-like peptidyl-prolyl isomerase
MFSLELIQTFRNSNVFTREEVNMLRIFKFNRFAILILASLLLGITGSELFAHSGHKHDTKPPINLPEVVARVNDQDIKRDVIYRELNKAIQNYKKKGMSLSADQMKTAAKKLTDDEIGRTLLLQQGKKIGLAITPAMVEKKLSEVKASFKSDSVFEHKLKDRGMTLDQYQEELRSDLIMDQVIKKEVESKIKIGEQDLKNYYEKNNRKYRTQDKTRASVILIKSPPDSSPERERKVRKKMSSILMQIKEGTEFEGLAKKFSEDSLASKGGDLGFFEKKKMFPPFSERAFSMKVGEVSEVFKTKHGFHVLKVTDKKSGVSRSFANEKENIRKTLTEKKSAEATRTYLETLKKQADLKTYF